MIHGRKGSLFEVGVRSRISSSVMPAPSQPSTSHTVIRSPGIQGSPPRFPGSIVILVLTGVIGLLSTMALRGGSHRLQRREESQQFIPEPQRDHSDIDTRLQQVHCCRVAAVCRSPGSAICKNPFEQLHFEAHRYGHRVGCRRGFGLIRQGRYVRLA